ncbi:hypothetical protein EVAR_7017_1 [Eumeta japonica]|uniref:Uncharacterized protein n=1 Tax=Eumeta variegata TaxID=151549 RepID=A0A4C1TGS0_EUMVA|nr:hypothetical protein EVAR_7017_1 [Eumeta japonica]
MRAIWKARGVKIGNRIKAVIDNEISISLKIKALTKSRLTFKMLYPSYRGLLRELSAASPETPDYDADRYSLMAV